MTVDDFWKLMDRVDRRTLKQGEGYDADAVEPLIDALLPLPRVELESFAEHLSNALYLLDGRKFCDAAGDFGDDGFLYARCFVVAMGREIFERAQGDPSMMPKSLNEWCEPLLYAPGEAWRRKTGEDWDCSPSVSYETGSNKSLW